MISVDEYKVLVEHVSVMIWRANTNAKLDYFNERWLTFTGYTLEQETNYGWMEGVHPEDLDSYMEIYNEAFQKRKTFEKTYRHRRHDGIYRHIFASANPIYDAQGRFTGYIGSFFDLTYLIEEFNIFWKVMKNGSKQQKCLLPICAGCKKIRDEQGLWHNVELYVKEHFAADFTHDICPECVKKLYPLLNESK